MFLVKQRCLLQNTLNIQVLLLLKYKVALPDVVLPVP